MATKTNYSCPHCSERLIVYINLSENPTHHCGNKNKTLALYTDSEIKNLQE